MRHTSRTGLRQGQLGSPTGVLAFRSALLIINAHMSDLGIMLVSTDSGLLYLSETWDSALLPGSLVTLPLLAQGPHFESQAF
jgi:hypothetical protein